MKSYKKKKIKRWSHRIALRDDEGNAVWQLMEGLNMCMQPKHHWQVNLQSPWSNKQEKDLVT